MSGFLDGGISSDVIGRKIAIYTRIACISVGIYDYVLTLPAEGRIYRRHGCFGTPSILFFLIRYMSILALFFSSFARFNEHLTIQQCHHFLLVSAVLRVFQMMAAQAILSWRTCNIAKGRKAVFWLLALLFVCASTVEWIISLYSFQVALIEGDCRNAGPTLTQFAWSFCACALLYVSVLLAICSWFLLRRKSKLGLIQRSTNIMLADGLCYFVALAVANIVNIAVFKVVESSEISQACTLPITTLFTWIMSQRIMIHLHDTTLKIKREQLVAKTITGTLSRRTQLSAHTIEEISRVVRSRFCTKDYEDDDYDDEKLEHGTSSAGWIRRRRGRVEMNPVDSDCYLDTISDICIEPRGNHAIAAGRLTQGESGFDSDVCGGDKCENRT